MSQELTVGKHTINEIMQLGKMLAESGYFRDKEGLVNAAKAVAKILAGQELGIPPFAAMAGIHIVEGKPVIGANLLAGLVKKSKKYDFSVIELTNQRCEVQFFRNEKAVGKNAFDMADAKRANLDWKDNWKKYPRNMMFARAMSDGVKQFCPDIFITGIYVDGADFDLVGPVEAVDPKYLDVKAEVGSGAEVHNIEYPRPDDLVATLNSTAELKALIKKEMGNEIDAQIMWPEYYTNLQRGLRMGKESNDWGMAIEFADAIHSEYHAISEGHLPGVDDDDDDDDDDDGVGYSDNESPEKYGAPSVNSIDYEETFDEMEPR